MLAQNFKTAADLAIQEWERDGLIQVLGLLERGNLKFHDFYDMSGARGDAFNMCTTGQITSCGTTACIAGWVYILKGRKTPHADKLEERVTPNPDLKNLYFPDFRGMDSMNEIQPGQAATALRNYLTRGAPHWEEIIIVD